MRSSGRSAIASLIRWAYAPRQLVGVVAPIDRALPHHRVAQVGEVGVVELDVPAPGGVERGDLVAVAPRQIGEEVVEIGVRLDVDAGTAAPEVHHRGRRDRDLRRRRRHRGEVLEVGDLDVADVPQRADDGQLRRRHVHGLGGVRARGDAAADGDAVELLEEVEVEPCPAELAVGHRSHPDRLQLPHGVGDRLVLDGAQLVGADRSPAARSARAAWTASGRSRLPT